MKPLLGGFFNGLINGGVNFILGNGELLRDGIRK